MDKYYLGIDVGRYDHQACLIDDQGEILFSVKFKANYRGFGKLLMHLNKQIGNQEFSRIPVALEATGIYWITVYEQLTKLGMEVIVLNPLQVKACQNRNIRGSKTDRIDASLIAEILRFGKYRPSSIPDEAEMELRQLTRLRSDFVNLTTGLKMKVMGLMDQVFPEYKDLFRNTFSATSRELLKKAVLPEEIMAISTRKLTRILTKASRGRMGLRKALDIRKTAASSFGVTLGMNALSLSIKIILDQIEHLESQVNQLEEEINRLFAKQKTTLTSIPGIGQITAATIRAEIGDFTRFANDKDGALKLVALAGIDPRLRESGRYQGKVKMSKRGSPYLRKAVRQAAFSAVYTAKDPMFTALYRKHLNKGKHHEVALSHVERKLLHVVYSLLKNKKEYQPHLIKRGES